MNSKVKPANKKIIIDASVPKELRVGIIEDSGKRNKSNLTDLHVEDKNHLQYKSNIYLGTITSIEPSLNAAFVLYDSNKRHGFLPIKEIQDQYFSESGKNKQPSSKPEKNINDQVSKTDDAVATTGGVNAASKDAQPKDDQPPAEAQKRNDKSNEALSIALNTSATTSSSSVNFEVANTDDSAIDTGSPIKSNNTRSRGNGHDNPLDQLSVGQRVVVQVVKEERGSKGAALTTHISLAGSYLVLMPNSPDITGISRRIEGNARDEVRELSKQLTCPDDMGFIIRTAGINQDVPQLQWDLDVLTSLWQAISKAVEANEPPVLIHQESDIVVCAVRDYLRSDVNELVVNDKDTFDKIHFYLTQVKPDFADKIVHYQDQAPLFCHYGIENQIEQAQQREVRLPSGGSIMIDHTEALVAIDVNSARAKGADIEDTAYQTNLEAADEVGRQLRLRDLGGLVVIDFIDMSMQKHQRAVENHLREALVDDKARIRIGRISPFGLLEMSRQRLRTSLGEVTKMACPRCSGQGLIQSVESFSLSILRKIREDVLSEQLLQIQLHVPLDVSAQLMNHHRMEVSDIETHGKTSILIVPNANYQTPQHKIKKIRFGEKGTKAAQMESKSYQLVEPMKSQRVEDASQQDNQQTAPISNVPLVNVADIPHPIRRAIPKQGLVKRLWDNMFVSNKIVAAATSDGADTGNEDDNIGNRKHSGNKQSKPGTRNRHPQRRSSGNRNITQNNNISPNIKTDQEKPLENNDKPKPARSINRRRRSKPVDNKNIGNGAGSTSTSTSTSVNEKKANDSNSKES